jgi:hypothetical protein
VDAGGHVVQHLGGEMRADVPLLPWTIEIRRRPLPPPQFSIRALLLVVAVTGVFLALVGELRRLGETMSYHAVQAVEVTKARSPSYDPRPMSQWHSAMSQRYRADFERLDLLVFLFILTVGAILAIGVLGRVIAWVRPASAVGTHRSWRGRPT